MSIRGVVSSHLLLGVTLWLTACGPQVPQLSAPFGLSAEAGPGSVTLRWQDSNEQAEGFTLYRRVQSEDVAEAEFESLVETAADTFSYVDDSVDISQSYLYRVHAKRGDTESEAAQLKEAVTPKPVTQTLTVNWRGDGGGELRGDPGSLSCTPKDGECGFDVPTDSGLSLSVFPDATSVFGGWGGDCSGTGGCDLTMDSAKEVEVRLEQARRALNVTKSGDGAGTVTSSNITTFECGPECDALEQSFVLGTTVALEAVAEPGSAFRGWDGACSGKGCEVSLDEDKTVTATFDKVPEPEIAAFTASSETVLRGEPVKLSWEVTPERDTKLSLESSRDEASDITGQTSLFVTPDQSTTYTLVAKNTSGEASKALSVTVKPAFELEVKIFGNEAGKVVSADGINCGNLCVKLYEKGTTVTLEAVEADAEFERWSPGCDSEAGTSCTVTMNSAKTIVANFRE